jgi:hypothetical protein
MSQTAVAPNIHQPFDGHGDFPSQVPFDLEFLVDDISDGGDFRIRKLIGFRVGANAGFPKDLTRFCPPYSVDIG